MPSIVGLITPASTSIAEPLRPPSTKDFLLPSLSSSVWRLSSSSRTFRAVHLHTQCVHARTYQVLCIYIQVACPFQDHPD